MVAGGMMRKRVVEPIVKPIVAPVVGAPEPSLPPDLVAPARGAAKPWVGCVERKPWEYRVTAVLPHLDTPELLAPVVSLLRLQTVRPYLLVIDTGSSREVCEQLEEWRAPDLEVHYVRAHGWQHSSEPVGVAQDLAQALCRSEFLFCTHVDCFLRRRDYIEWLAGQCGPACPAVGYEMSPRDWITADWRGMVSHTATLLHMPTIHSLGASWSFERAHVQFGVSRTMDQAWPDTETCFNLCLRAARVRPMLIGKEGNYARHVDENVDHFRSYPGSKLLAPEYHAKACEWRDLAVREAFARVALWLAEVGS